MQFFHSKIAVFFLLAIKSAVDKGDTLSCLSTCWGWPSVDGSCPTPALPWEFLPEHPSHWQGALSRERSFLIFSYLFLIGVYFVHKDLWITISSTVCNIPALYFGDQIVPDIVPQAGSCVFLKYHKWFNNHNTTTQAGDVVQGTLIKALASYASDSGLISSTSWSLAKRELWAQK